MEINNDERWERISKSYREKLVVRVASGTKKKAIDFLLPGYVIREKMNVIAGQFGDGKSLLTLAMAARITQGGSHSSWFDPTPTQQGRVLIISTEDDYEDTICPRLAAAGASMDRVAHIDSIRMINGDFRPFEFSVEKDVQILCDWVEDNGGIDLIVIDPVSQAISGDVKNSSKTQTAFEKLAKLAKRLHCAIVGITHVSKTTKNKAPLSRIAGPQAITGAPRSVMLTAKKTISPEDGFNYVLVQTKTSLCKTVGGFSYRIESVEIEGDDGPIETSKIVWGEPIYGDPMELLQEAEGDEASVKPSVVSNAVAFLKETLANGSLLSSDVTKKATALGISYAALNRARNAVGVLSSKKKGEGQFSPFEWSLPEIKSD